MNDAINNMDCVGAYGFRLYHDSERQSDIGEGEAHALQFCNKIPEKAITPYRSEKTKAQMAQFDRFVKEIIQDDKKYLKPYPQTRCETEYNTGYR